MKKTYIIGIVLLVIILGFVSYFATNNKDNLLPKEVETGSNLPPKNENLKEFIVAGKNFSFSPNIISVKKGDEVKIIFKNEEGTHNLKIDEFNVATKVIKSGEEDSIEFIADKVGNFQYYCSVGTHRNLGMWGTFKVTE